MDTGEFRIFGKASVDYVADYMLNIRKRQTVHSVKPGYLKSHISENPPKHGEKWENLLDDMENFIMPGLCHWHSPYFHAYYPTSNSFPSVVGEILMAGLGGLALDWESNPVATELEIQMMDWMAKMLGLPSYFLNESEGPGGGVLQTSASESTLLSVLMGKHITTKRLLNNNPNLTQEEVHGKLVAYTSIESNCSVEKSGLLASIKMRLLPTDSEGSLRGDVFQAAVTADKNKGLIPCCLVATIGTTGRCGFDSLEELGEICQKENIWFHVDAAYAGAALVCPEYRYLLKGIEYVDSFCFNPHKWFLTTLDCSALWFKNTKPVEEALNILSNLSIQPQFEPDIQSLQIPTMRKFRALKLWFVMRIYGVKGIQKHIRHQISMAKLMEQLVRNDDRFEVLTSSMGVVNFRLKGDDSLTDNLIDKITERKILFLMHNRVLKKSVIRFVVCSEFITADDIAFIWKEICTSIEVLKDTN